jgi:hypothetical protein
MKSYFMLAALIAGSACKHSDDRIVSDSQFQSKPTNQDSYEYDQLCGNEIARLYKERIAQDKDHKGRPMTGKLQGDSIQTYDALRKFQSLYVKNKAASFPESLKFGEDFITWADKNPKDLLSYFSFVKVDRLKDPNGLNPQVGTILAWSPMDCTDRTFTPLLPKGDIQVIVDNSGFNIMAGRCQGEGENARPPSIYQPVMKKGGSSLCAK